MKLPPVLEKAGTRISPALKAAFGTLSPEIRVVVEYHMGWRDAAGAPVAKQSSKGVRPGLALLGAAAAGTGPVEVAIPGAIAVEALHNCAFLLDDVMDGDRYRRQRETAWVVFGTGRSTLAGTSLFVLGTQTLMEAGSAYRDRAVALYLSTFREMLAGQAIDLCLEGANAVSVERSTEMTQWKTAALMRCATTLGAVLAGASAEVEAALRTYGEALGFAFQARDDLLGIWGEPRETGGRPRGFDLKARKGTIPIAYALDTDSGELAQVLAQPRLTDDDVVRATKLVEAAGGRERTAELAQSKVDESVVAIASLGLSPELHDGFIAIAEMGRPDWRA